MLSLTRPWLGGGVRWVVLAAALGWLGWIGAAWIRGEFGVSLPTKARIPRLAAWLGTLSLLAVFVVHGPVVGYLCFGTAHALEYVAFVHHFGRQKFGGGDEAPRRGVLPTVLRHATVSAPLLIAALLGAYWLLLDARTTELFLVYYTATSLLHFWYAGLIWKVSAPVVSRPLGIVATR